MAGNSSTTVVLGGEENNNILNPDDFKHGQFNTDQTDEERRKLRQEYLVLIGDLRQNQPDFTDPSSDRLDDALTETIELSKNVKKSAEKVLDSMAVRIICSYSREQAQNVRTDFVKFVPEEFAEKLITFVGGRQNGETSGPVKISAQGWCALGKATHKFFSKSPALHIMSGTFKRELLPLPIGKANKSRRKFVKDIDDENVKDTIPRKLESFDEDDSNGTSQHIARVFRLLQKYYKDLDNIPLCYFSFVLDPDSFGRTVENIFHTSFIVSRGLAKLSLDDDGLPQIEPLPLEEEEDRSNVVQKPHHQTIITITPADWKELVQTFGVENAAILHPSRPTT
ncbi:non-structural maintenance of chromosomes element 4 homolog A-like [Argopecten irradians]|uniref:non-structural maintenance of chromosomes element 4 homolog A-like n=1 Tax=Argopecten irradians TaxID=31199 RepID=UPI0037140BBF